MASRRPSIVVQCGYEAGNRSHITEEYFRGTRISQSEWIVEVTSCPSGFVCILMVPFKMIAWNSRGGLTMVRKQKFLRFLGRKYGVSILGLVETKKELVDDFLINKLWANSDYDFAFVPSVGSSAGLCLIWNSILISNHSVLKGDRWISLSFQWCEQNIRIILVYAPTDALGRQALWAELQHLVDFDGAILFIGDFNEVTNPAERLNGGYFSTSMQEFNIFINTAELLDCPFMEESILGVTLFPLLGLIEGTWSDLPDMHIVPKLRCLRNSLKAWNKDVFGNPNTALSMISQELEDFEVLSESRQLSSVEIDRFQMLKEEELKVQNRLQSLWAQKARVKWQLEGDKNTKFFHASASAHFRNNYISSLKYNGKVYSDPDSVKSAARSYFESLFQQPVASSFSLQGIEFSTLSETQSNLLAVPFSKGEIYSALMSCDSAKAPGPDGFNFFFYKKAWPVLKPDILSVFSDFFRTAKLSKGINSSFLLLIPKVAGTNSLSEFRPISLINGIYKLISKVLSFRLRLVLPCLIYDNQQAFIKGRSILECSMAATQVIHIMSSRREKTFLLKLDFHKAFDCLSWDFLHKVMRRMGFSDKWITWINECLSTAHISVLVNGNPSTPFNMRRGVRQGDSLSPFLFLLAVEGLKCLLDKAQEVGLIEGVTISDALTDLSLLQFADDTLIFIPAVLHQIRNLKVIVHCFELISGLKINFSKSSLVGIGVQSDFLSSAAALLGCTIDSLPIKYLGLPLTNKRISASDWSPVVNQFQHKLSLWKGKLLSAAGRLVLIKSTLASFPLYFMSIFSMTEQIRHCLQSHMSRFLWNGTQSRRAGEKLSQGQEDVFLLSGRIYADCVWTMLQYGTSSYLIVIPKLIQFWRQSLRASEIYDMHRLIEAIQDYHLRDTGDDIIFWAPTKASFSVSSFMDLYFTSTQYPHQTWLFSKGWNSQAPPRVKFYTWLLLHGRITSKAFLLLRHILTEENCTCCYCGAFEDQDHIIIHCPRSFNLWYRVAYLMGFSWVMPLTMRVFCNAWVLLVKGELPNMFRLTLWEHLV